MGTSKPESEINNPDVTSGSYTMVIMYCLAAVVLSIIDTLSFKYLFEKINVDRKQARVVGVVSLFIYGLTGTICLVVATVFGYGLFSMSLSSVLMCVLCAMILHASLTLYMMSMAIGSAGLTVAIYISFGGI